VYGLAADDARSGAAVARIFEVKGRPGRPSADRAPRGAEDLDRWASVVPEAADRLTRAAWPGPLTVIVPRRDDVLDLVTGGRDTVGLRIPAHPMALALLTGAVSHSPLRRPTGSDRSARPPPNTCCVISAIASIRRGT
jgi:L-threonylcarbamoyladenylate synthase